MFILRKSTMYFLKQMTVLGAKMCIIYNYFNLLKPIGYVMHNQFNIQQLYILPTQNKQRLVPLTA